jgi:predicted transcriptional regulator
VERLGGGELESRVMDVLWDGPGWMTPGDVHEVIATERPTGYTTVLTVLVRLWQKGRLDREREGRAYAYNPTVSREEHTAERMQQLLVAANNSSSALGHFVETLRPQQLDQLRRALKARKKQ